MNYWGKENKMLIERGRGWENIKRWLNRKRKKIKKLKWKKWRFN